MRFNDDVRDMNDDINALVSEAKIRKRMSDEELGKQVAMKGSSIQNYRSAHTFPRMPFWKVCAIAKLAGYEISFSRKGGARND